MKKLIILFVFAVSLLISNFVSQAIAQQVSEKREPSVPPPSTAGQDPQDLTEAESLTPGTSLKANYRRPWLDRQERSRPARRDLSFTDKYYSNDSLTGIVTSMMATRRNKLTLAPTGMMMDSGFSYSLPVSQYFSPFAAFQPSMTDAFINAPQTMWAAGLQIPLIRTKDAGQDLSLRFSTAMDHKYQPIFFFSFNVMSLGRK